MVPGALAFGEDVLAFERCGDGGDMSDSEGVKDERGDKDSM